ncbi:MAG: helix-turn-helix domain-containing protein [Candidatus Tectomicrobia bacterium]|nr:helix-turn-helix domain-containing protein [Candidatus Tectomicrobia bacterium]
MRFVQRLSPAAKTALEEYLQTDQYPHVRQRVHAILLSAKGYTVETLSDIFDVDENTIIEWITQWERKDIYSFISASYPYDSSQNISNNKELLSDLLKYKIEEGRELLGHYLRAFAIFVTITAVLIKFAFDKNSTELMRQALTGTGLVLSVMGFAVYAFGKIVRHAVCIEAEKLSNTLGVGDFRPMLLPVKYVGIVVLLASILGTIGWGLVFWNLTMASAPVP